eukprot:CAMPEP_0194274886 /NCGR_PEP_ID=MMETSP0169-20130528/7870_1 /TAXON_ID=218684 /ORGANISM="Corethron pennatum, Strain L29A3" /LENGTH=132 /DNA_ID=CAMNT_0039018217 /DNA_START=108 /DNA_END=502 /DNA_ORIENTATION=+
MMRSISFLGALILAASFRPSECYTATHRSSGGYPRSSPRTSIHQQRIQQTSLHSTRIMFRNGDEDEEVRSPVEFATVRTEPAVPRREVLRRLPLSSSDFLAMAADLEEDEHMLWLGRAGMVAFSLLVAVEAG